MFDTSKPLSHEEIVHLKERFLVQAKCKHTSPIWSDVYWSIVKELDHLDLMHNRTTIKET